MTAAAADYNHYSEHDEEDFILPYFRFKSSGFFVDIGANNGWKGSNTRALADLGWRGLLVEADPNTYRALQEFCRGQSRLKTFWAAVTDRNGGTPFYSHNDLHSGLSSLRPIYPSASTQVEVPMITLDQLIHVFDLSAIDFLAIDAEYEDETILKAYSFQVRPHLVMCEHGNRVDSFDALMASHNYKRVFMNVGNVAYAPLAHTGLE